MPEAKDLTVKGLALAQQKAKKDLSSAIEKMCREFNQSTGLFITGLKVDWVTHRSSTLSGDVVDGVVVTDIHLETNINDHCS